LIINFLKEFAWASSFSFSEIKNRSNFLNKAEWIY